MFIAKRSVSGSGIASGYSQITLDEILIGLGADDSNWRA